MSGTFAASEAPTRPDAANAQAWGRLTSAFADLDAREANDAVALLIAWTKLGPNRRVLISALAREFGVARRCEARRRLHKTREHRRLAQ